MSCTYYRWEGGSFSGDYWCDKKDGRVDSDHYCRYCRGWNYDECPIYRRTESTGGCFITTVTCEILKLPDNTPVLSVLRSFRDNILQKDKQHEEILKIYDTIGPMIASGLRKDNNKEQLSVVIYNNFLEPISNYIKNENYKVAIDGYKQLTEWLIIYFGLTSEYEHLKQINYGYNNDFDQSKAGHGRRKKLNFKRG